MKLQHSQPSLDQSDFESLRKVFTSKYLAKGALTRDFEIALAERYQRKHAIFVSSGMAALHLSLCALGIKANDEICVPSFVCTALLNAIHLCQAKPAITDTPHHGFLMDPNMNFASASTKAIIYPQMFGAQTKLKLPSAVPVIEDCAMSLGSKALRQGQLSIASFYATKMITTGQGGAIFTDDKSLANEIRDLIDYDNRAQYRLRFNYAPTDLSAALGLNQLSKLDHLLEERDQISQQYDSLFQKYCPSVLALPEGLSKSYQGIFRYWIQSDAKQALIGHLQSNEIEAKAPVFKPLHQYLHLDDADYPHCTATFNKMISLPFYPGLKKTDLQRVVESVACLKN